MNDMISLHLPGTLPGDMISDFLSKCSQKYPYIAEGVDLASWGEKIRKFAYAVCVENNGSIDTACFYYFDGDNKVGFITLIAVLSARHSGVGSTIMNVCVDDLKARGAGKVRLEVLRKNISALAFYVRNGFVTIEDRGDKFLMERVLK